MLLPSTTEPGAPAAKMHRPGPGATRGQAQDGIAQASSRGAAPGAKGQKVRLKGLVIL